VQTSNEFKELTLEAANKQKEELARFKSEIIEIKRATPGVNITEELSAKNTAGLLKSSEIEVLNENGVIKIVNEDQSTLTKISETETKPKIQNVLNYFKDKILKSDAIWESFKRKLYVPGIVDNGDSESLKLKDLNSINDT
jgi:hypothetical protein